MKNKKSNESVNYILSIDEPLRSSNYSIVKYRRSSESLYNLTEAETEKLKSSEVPKDVNPRAFSSKKKQKGNEKTPKRKSTPSEAQNID